MEHVSKNPIGRPARIALCLGLLNAAVFAGVDDGQTRLKWDANGEADLDCYAVYRATESGGPYQKINPTPVRNNEYLDTQLNTDLTYYYVVTALDHQGNESPYSSEVATMPVPASSSEETLPTLFADAGADQDVQTSKLTTLDATASTDTAGLDLVGFLWTQLEGPYVELSDDTSSAPTFVAPVAEEDVLLSFQVTVWNSSLESDVSVPVFVTVHNDWPIPKPQVRVVEPGIPEGTELVNNQVGIDRTIILDGSTSFDPDGKVMAYFWVREDAGPAMELTDDVAAITQGVTPSVDRPMTFTYALYVWDENGAMSSEKIEFVVSPGAPLAKAGPDQTVDTGSLVFLDSSQSSDVDGEIVERMWIQIAGALAPLDDDSATVASFIAPDTTEEILLTFALFVFDDAMNSGSDTVNVTVRPGAVEEMNQAPVAEAGPSIKTKGQLRVTLDGSESYDLDNDLLSYRWRQTQGDPVILNDEDQAVAYFTAPYADDKITLIFELTVSDGVDSHSDKVTVVVLPGRPMAR